METTEAKFQKGDVVRCNQSNTVIHANREYTVKSVTDWGLQFEECPDFFHTPTPGRFELLRRDRSPSQPAPAKPSEVAKVDLFAVHLRSERNIADHMVKVPDVAKRNEQARKRMAAMSLDRPLEADQRRWERLVTSSRHPVTGRPIAAGGRRE